MRIRATAAASAVIFWIFALSLATSGAGAEAAAESRNVPAEASSKFTEAQREYIHSWIKELVPECPREPAAMAVERFLEELQRHSSPDLERLMSPGFPVANHHSTLLRLVGAQLTGAAHAGLREEVARRRVQAILARDGAGKARGEAEAAELVAKIKGMGSVYSKRLFEGRMEDDDAALLLKKAREFGAAPVAAAPVKPKVLSAGDIASEFARRNQEGSAWQRLRALSIQSRLKTSAGEELQVLLFKLRPDRFRMAMVAGDTTRLLTAFDGEKHWQQVRGQAPQTIPLTAVGSRRYLGEFADPLVAEEGIGYERLADGTADGKKVYRIAVRRPDGSGYVAWIEPETFHQVGRETEDKQTIRYSDFRVVAGITMAFREESTDAEGRKNVLTLTAVNPNPGLIQAFFETPEAGNPGYFELERMVGRPPLAAAK